MNVMCDCAYLDCRFAELLAQHGNLSSTSGADICLPGSANIKIQFKNKTLEDVVIDTNVDVEVCFFTPITMC